jgi:hypothetical protein
MAAYPITNPDGSNLIEALNYVASGPAGIGQQLDGFAAYADAPYLTGNKQTPFINKNTTVMYSGIADISSIDWIDGYTIKYNYLYGPYPGAIFTPGATLLVQGALPYEYNAPGAYYGSSSYNATIVESTDSYVITRSNKFIPNLGTGSGGQASVFVTTQAGTGGLGTRISTDLIGNVTVDAGNSLVSVTAQLEILTNTYAVLWLAPDPMSSHTLNYFVELNRYKATNIGTVSNPIYDYAFDTVVSRRRIYITNLTTPTRGIPLTYTITGGTPAVGSAGNYFPVAVETFTPPGVGGVGAVVDVDITNDTVDYAAGTTVTAFGTAGGNYRNGDALYIPGDVLGGLFPDNNLLLEVSSSTDTADISIGPSETIFTTIYDRPSTGLYRYVVQIKVVPQPGDGVAAMQIRLGRRSLTAQVIKQ